jgi:DNA-binding response OmpR family regulator
MIAGNILIVEDDKSISKLIRYNLEKADFACEVAITGEDALEVLEKKPVDLIVLDIMLPKMDGLETCKRIKQDSRLSSIPIIMVTAKGEEIDRIVGFELGVDDYMVKPFSPRELVLRVKAILKRGEKKESLKEILQVEGLKINIPKHKVFVQERIVKLTAMEFKLLLILMQRMGRVQSREQLLEDVWELTADVTTRTVDTHIKRLRQKLETMGDVIETVRGYGYCISDERLG